MKQTFTHFIYGCLVLSAISALSACQDVDAPSWQQQPSPLQVSATIAAETPLSRADVVPSSYDRTAFLAGDVIKVERQGATTGLTPASCTYKRSSAGAWEWTAAAAETTAGPFYTYENGKTFTATYPADFSGIAADQTGDGFRQSNKLTATATAAAGKVTFNFAPAFTKITVIIYYQTAEAVPAAAPLTLAADKLRGGTGSESVNCLCKTTAAATEHTWSGIINPGTYALSISLGSITYTAASKQYTRATHYTYTLYRNGDRLQLGSVTGITAFPDTGTTAGSDISAS
ncbi:hypothetical protein [Bacteroides sp.]|uniref:hypothetical protein n=1 Tax=Bacteroides sp. TaxID=29523 RepID=UPI003AB7F3CF